MIKFGRLEHLLYFYTDTSVDSDEVPTWTLVSALADWPGRSVPVSGREKYRGQQLEATTTHVIETHFDPLKRITPLMRIQVAQSPTDTTWLEIKSIENLDGADRWLLIQATELNDERLGGV